MGRVWNGVKSGASWTADASKTLYSYVPGVPSERKKVRRAHKHDSEEQRWQEKEKQKAEKLEKQQARPGSDAGAEKGDALPRFISFTELIFRRGAAWIPGTNDPLVAELIRTTKTDTFLEVIRTGERSIRDPLGRKLSVDLRTLNEQNDNPYDGSMVEVREKLAAKLKDGKTGDLSLDEIEIIFAAMVGEAYFPGTEIPVWSDWTDHPEHNLISSPPDAFFDALWMFGEDSTRAPAGPGKEIASVLKELTKKQSLVSKAVDKLRMLKVERGVIDVRLVNSYLTCDLLEFLHRFGKDVLAVSEATSGQMVTERNVPGIGEREIMTKEIVDKLTTDLMLVVGAETPDKDPLAKFERILKPLEAFESGAFTKEEFEALEMLHKLMAPSDMAAPQAAGTGSNESRVENLRNSLLPAPLRELGEKSEEAARLCGSDDTVALAQAMLEEYSEKHLPALGGELPEDARKLLTELKETLKVRAELLEIREKKDSTDREIKEGKERRITAILKDIENLDVTAPLKRDLSPLLERVETMCSQERPALQRQAVEAITAFENKYSRTTPLPSELHEGFAKLQSAVDARVAIVAQMKAKGELLTELEKRKAENESNIAALSKVFSHCYPPDKLGKFKAVLAKEGEEKAVMDTLERLEPWVQSQPGLPSEVLAGIDKLRQALYIRMELNEKIAKAPTPKIQVEVEELDKKKKENAERIGELAQALALSPVQKELDSALRDVKSLCARGEEKKAAELLGDFNRRMRYPVREVCHRLLEEYESKPVAAGHRTLKFSEAIIALNVLEGGERNPEEMPGTKKRGMWTAKKLAWLNKSFTELLGKVRMRAKRMHRYVWHMRLRHGWRALPILAPIMTALVAPALTYLSLPLLWSTYPYYYAKFWAKGRTLRGDRKLTERLEGLNAIANDQLSGTMTPEGAVLLARTNATAAMLVKERCREGGERLDDLDTRYRAILDREIGRKMESIKSREDRVNELLAKDISKSGTLRELVRTDGERRTLRESREFKLFVDLAGLRAERKQLMEGAIDEESSARIRDIEAKELEMLKAGSGKAVTELLELRALAHEILESGVEKNLHMLGQAIAKRAELIPGTDAELAALTPEMLEQMKSLSATQAELLDDTMGKVGEGQLGLGNERRAAMAENARFREMGLSGVFWGVLAGPFAAAWILVTGYGLAAEKPHLVEWPVEVKWGMPPVGEWPFHGSPFAGMDKNAWVNPQNWHYNFAGPRPDTRGSYVLPRQLAEYSDYEMKLFYNVGNVLPEEVKEAYEAARKAGMKEKDASAHAYNEAGRLAKGRLKYLRETMQPSPWAKGGREIPGPLTILEELRRGSVIEDIVYENPKERSKARSNSALMPWRKPRPDDLTLTDPVLSREPYMADRLVKALMSDPRFKEVRGGLPKDARKLPNALAARNLQEFPFVWDLYGLGYVQRRADIEFADSFGIHGREHGAKKQGTKARDAKEHVDFLIANPVFRNQVGRWVRLGSDELFLKKENADTLVGYVMDEARKAIGTPDVVQVAVEEPANAAKLLRATGVDEYLQSLDRAHSAAMFFMGTADGMNRYLQRSSEANRMSPDAGQAAFFGAVNRYLSSERTERDVLVMLAAIKPEEAEGIMKAAAELRKGAADARQQLPEAKPADAARLLGIYDEFGRNAPLRNLFISSARKYIRPEAAETAPSEAGEKPAAEAGEAVQPETAPASMPAGKAGLEDPLAKLLVDVGDDVRAMLLRRVAYAKLANSALAAGTLERRGREFEQARTRERLAEIMRLYNLKTEETARFVMEYPSLEELLGKLRSSEKTAIKIKVGQEELLVREAMVHKGKKGFISDFNAFRVPEGPKVRWAVRAGLYLDFETSERDKKARQERQDKALKIASVEKQLAEVNKELGIPAQEDAPGIEKELADLKSELAALEGERKGLDRAWAKNLFRTGEGIETRKAKADQRVEEKKRQIKEKEDRLNTLWDAKKQLELELRTLKDELTAADKAEKAKAEAAKAGARLWGSDAAVALKKAMAGFAKDAKAVWTPIARDAEKAKRIVAALNSLKLESEEEKKAKEALVRLLSTGNFDGKDRPAAVARVKAVKALRQDSMEAAILTMAAQADIEAQSQRILSDFILSLSKSKDMGEKAREIEGKYGIKVSFNPDGSLRSIELPKETDKKKLKALDGKLKALNSRLAEYFLASYSM